MILFSQFMLSEKWLSLHRWCPMGGGVISETTRYNPGPALATAGNRRTALRPASFTPHASKLGGRGGGGAKH